MKKSPDEQKFEDLLRSSRLVADGFMGTDKRSIPEIIENDLADLARLKITPAQIADRMQEITQKAIAGLGNWVDIDSDLQAKVDEAKGALPCPWPHPGHVSKRVTYLKNTTAGDMIKWSDLNIHMIAEHSFFEGKGAAFRLEPYELTRLIFPSPPRSP